MLSNSLLRVGIVGSGGIAAQHAIGWNAYPQYATIAALAELDTDRANAFNLTHTDGNAKIYPSLEAMLEADEVDIIDICLPHHLHTEAVIAAAQAGKAILCEKPLCTSLEDARKIKAVVDDAGVPFMSGHNQVFQPSLIEARRLMAAGVIGTPFLMRSIETFRNQAYDPYSYAPLPPSGPRGWRTDVKAAGGGELLDTGYHSTYRLLALAGEDKPVEVTGFLSRFHIADWPTEDTGQVTIRFASGAIGEILTSWAFDVDGGRQFEVSGSLGAVGGGKTFVSHQLYGWDEAARREIPGTHTFTAEIGQFIEVVRENASNPADIDTAIRVLQVIKAAYLSAKLGQTVSLPDDPSADPVAGKGAATPFDVDVLDDVLL